MFVSSALVALQTPPSGTINFLLNDMTTQNGAIRQIAGSHLSVANPPTPDEEPEWMRLSTLVGAPAGSGVLRNTSCWHGATPNVSNGATRE